ncbi:MAG: hypothetical protein IJP29_07305 [Lachnospiraceae bacterium]|nr:hypothetical protein [Lachnospiraceae bacterium]
MDEKRDRMSNDERVSYMIAHLMQSKRYRATVYRIYPIIICFCFFSLACSQLSEYVYLIVITLIAILIFVGIPLIRRKVDSNKIYELIECNINREELCIVPSGTRYPRMGVYCIVAYYVEESCTYKFTGKVRDDQDDLYRVFVKLKQEGEFPKVKVLVNPQNYKDYKVLGYEFIEETIRQNKEMVYKQLEQYYDESWKY